VSLVIALGELSWPLSCDTCLMPAATQNNLGIALRAQGERSPGEESRKLLGQAGEAFRNALQIYTRDRLPQYWAMAQNYLGVALEVQGERSGGEESRKLLEHAPEAYCSAMQVFSRDEFPQHGTRSKAI
jgi:hypothetical protein